MIPILVIRQGNAMPYRLWHYACKLAIPLLACVFLGMMVRGRVADIIGVVALVTIIGLGFTGAVMGILMVLGKLRMRCPFCGQMGPAWGSKEEGIRMECRTCGEIWSGGTLGMAIFREYDPATPRRKRDPSLPAIPMTFFDGRAPFDEPGMAHVDRVYRLAWDEMTKEDWDRLESIYPSLPGWVGDEAGPRWFGKDESQPPHLTASVEPPGLQVTGVLPAAKFIEWHEQFMNAIRDFPALEEP
jgi:hypothetical protein